MADEPGSRDPDLSSLLQGLPFFLGAPLPFVPPVPADIWLQMWAPLLFGPYRVFLEWYKAMIEEWNKDHVDDSLRAMGNEFLRSSLAALHTSREVRAKLTQIQLKSIESYLQLLDKLASSGGQPKS